MPRKGRLAKPSCLLDLLIARRNQTLILFGQTKVLPSILKDVKSLHQVQTLVEAIVSKCYCGRRGFDDPCCLGGSPSLDCRPLLGSYIWLSEVSLQEGPSQQRKVCFCQALLLWCKNLFMPSTCYQLSCSDMKPLFRNTQNNHDVEKQNSTYLMKYSGWGTSSSFLAFLVRKDLTAYSTADHWGGKRGRLAERELR